MTSIFLRNIHHTAINGLVTMIFFAMMVFSSPLRAENLERVVIISDGTHHEFKVEIMRKSHERARGLMYRKHMDHDAGMLFDFGRQLTARMWMRNTFIPLDMLFVQEDGKIINIAQNTVPHSEEILSSISEVRYVLEINGGISEKLGIKAGDHIELPKP